MKAQLTGKKYNKGLTCRTTTEGFATLEVLIAFAVLILCISAVIFVSLGNQSITIDSQTNNEAVTQAQKALEDARANSRKNFLSVISASFSIPSGPITYNGTNTVTDISPCLKQVVTKLTWSTDSRIQYSTLSTLLGDPQQILAMGGGCATSPPSGGDDWHNPQLLTSVSRSHLGTVDTNGISILNNVLYIASGGSALNKPDIIAEDISNLTIANPGGLVDGDREDEGLKHYNAIDVARDTTSGNTYAYMYVGNDAATNQFQVLNVSNALMVPGGIPTPPQASAIKTFPPSTPANGGETIFYYKNKVYIGIGYNVSNPELRIYDVTNPLSPVSVSSYNVNHNIYKIIVRDQIIAGVTKTLAYLTLSASSGSPEFIVLDVTNPASINQIGFFNPPGDAYGLSLYILGNKAYLGRAGDGTNPNFYVIDITDPTNPTSCLTCHSTSSILPLNEDVNDLVVTGGFAFLATENALRIFNVSNSASIVRSSVSPFGVYPTPFTSVDIDTSKNLVYATHANQGSTAFYVLYSAP